MCLSTAHTAPAPTLAAHIAWCELERRALARSFTRASETHPYRSNNSPMPMHMFVGGFRLQTGQLSHGYHYLHAYFVYVI